MHISSVHAFRRLPRGIPVDEAVPFDPDSPAGAYDRTKAEGTLAILEAVREGLDAVVVCPSGIIGPDDYRKSEMGQAILDFARAKLHLLVDSAYDFVDVRDVVQGLVLAGEKGHAGEIYILSGARAKKYSPSKSWGCILSLKSVFWLNACTAHRGLGRESIRPASLASAR